MGRRKEGRRGGAVPAPGRVGLSPLARGASGLRAGRFWMWLRVACEGPGPGVVLAQPGRPTHW